jgi:hypothetical protein
MPKLTAVSTKNRFVPQAQNARNPARNEKTTQAGGLIDV